MNQDRSTTTTNSQIKEGYKQTEVGIIPEDWNVNNLGNFITLQRGYDLPHRERKIGNIPIITSSGFGGTHSEFRALSPGVVTGRYGTIGDVFYVQEDFWPLNTTLYVKNFYGNNPLFASYLLKTIDFHSHSGKSGVPGVNRNDLHELIVCIPPLPEQEAIASTLSDIDALIESLDRLLIKKRQIKQGAMQELLRSKDGWMEKRLGDVAHIQTGSRNNQDKVEDGEYPLFVRSATVERINIYSYECEAILIPGEGGIGSIFHYINGRFDAHQRVYVIRQFSEEISGKYIYLYMSKNFGLHAMQNSVKATVDSLRLPTFQNFQIFVPSTLEEQIEIANILSDMDAEIDSISAKLTKTRQLKQGMMHELLTGRIRLVES